MNKKRHDEESIDLHGEIRRNISDAQSLMAVKQRIVRILPHALKKRRKAAVFTKKPGIFHARQVVKRKEIVAVRHAMFFRQSAARRACCTVRLDDSVRIAQGCVGRCLRRRQFEGGTRRKRRSRQAAQRLKRGSSPAFSKEGTNAYHRLRKRVRLSHGQRPEGQSRALSS